MMGWSRVVAIATAAGAILAGAGCGSGSGDPAAERPEAARVGSATLTADALSALLVLGQPLPLTEAVARDVARHWQDIAALASVGLDSLARPDWVRAAVWPEYRAELLSDHLEEVVGDMGEASGPEVEAAYVGGRFRLPARILRRTGPQDHPDERRRQREAAFAIHQALLEGRPWAEAVARSDDDRGRDRAGLLGLVERGDLEPGLDGVVFALDPGQISQVVETGEGYQIVYRPRLEEVRAVFARELRAARAADARQAWVDSLVAAAEVQFVEGAESRLVRLADPGARGEGEPLARWSGGRLDDTMAVRYLATLDRPDRQRLRDDPAEAPDLLQAIAAQEVTWQALGPTSGPSETTWAAAEDAWLRQVDGYRDVVADPEAYLEAVVSRRRDPVSVPPAILAAVEARGDPVALSWPGLGEAVERARRMVSAAAGG